MKSKKPKTEKKKMPPSPSPAKNEASVPKKKRHQRLPAKPGNPQGQVNSPIRLPQKGDEILVNKKVMNDYQKTNLLV